MSLFEDLVKSEISKLPSIKRSGSSYTFILCPYHQEKTPSGRILHHPDGRGMGNFKCYSCGQTASWNELARVLGLQTYGKAAARQDSLQVPKSNLDDYDSKFLGGLDPAHEDLKLYDLSNEKAILRSGLNPTNKWRGFRLDFLKSLDIKLAKVVDTGRYYLYLPITIRGDTKGYIKAQLQKPKNKEIPSYINSKGGWSLKYGLFPYDQAVALMKEKSLSTIVLVEGPRDALRLIRFSIPAVCIMGTHSWSKSKLRQLEFSGASRIVLMMDGDKAGRAATRLIQTGKDPNGNQRTARLDSIFTVKVVRLWNADKMSGSNETKYDPGNCPTDYLVKVKNLLK